MSADYLHFRRLAVGHLKGLLYCEEMYNPLQIKVYTLQRFMQTTTFMPRDLENRCRGVPRGLAYVYDIFKAKMQEVFLLLRNMEVSHSAKSFCPTGKIVELCEYFFETYLLRNTQWPEFVLRTPGRISDNPETANLQASNVMMRQRDDLRRFFYACVFADAKGSDKKWNLFATYNTSWDQRTSFTMHFGFIPLEDLLHMEEIWRIWVRNTLWCLIDFIEGRLGVESIEGQALLQIQQECVMSLRKQVHAEVKRRYAREIRRRGLIARQQRVLNRIQAQDHYYLAHCQEMFLGDKVPVNLMYDTTAWWEYYYEFCVPKREPSPEALEFRRKWQEEVRLEREEWQKEVAEANARHRAAVAALKQGPTLGEEEKFELQESEMAEEVENLYERTLQEATPEERETIQREEEEIKNEIEVWKASILNPAPPVRELSKLTTAAEARALDEERRKEKEQQEKEDEERYQRRKKRREEQRARQTQLASQRIKEGKQEIVDSTEKPKEEKKEEKKLAKQKEEKKEKPTNQKASNTVYDRIITAKRVSAKKKPERNEKIDNQTK